MRAPLRSKANWICVPLAIVVAVVLGDLVLTSGVSASGERAPYRLDDARWAAMPVTYWVDSRFTPEENAAIRAAFAAWEREPDSPARFVYAGTREAPSGPSVDGLNTIIKSERPVHDTELGVAAIAVRTVAAEPDGVRDPGAYGDADIALDYSGQIRWSASGASDAHDLQSVVTHEVGHLLGLDDVDDPGQVMYHISSPGEVWKRVLCWGDRAGLCTAYPRQPRVSTN